MSKQKYMGIYKLKKWSIKEIRINHIDIQILDSNRNFIDTMITYKGSAFNGTFIYGASDIPNRT